MNDLIFILKFFVSVLSLAFATAIVMPLLFLTSVVLSPFIVTYLVYRAVNPENPKWTILAYNERDGPSRIC